MMETVIVYVILGFVGLLSVRSLYRTFTGKDEGRGCTGSPCGGDCACTVPGEERPRKEETNR